jgi:hypothetical protein
MNGEMGGQSKTASAPSSENRGGNLRLLRFPSPVVHDFPVKLPRLVPMQRPYPDFVPTVNTAAQVQSMPPMSQTPFEPVNPIQRRAGDDGLLRLPPNQGRSDIPPEHFDGLPFPMLRLTNSDGYRAPFFVPPDQISNYGLGRVDSGTNVGGNKSHYLGSLARQSPQLLKLNMESPGRSDVSSAYNTLVDMLLVSVFQYSYWRNDVFIDAYSIVDTFGKFSYLFRYLVELHYRTCSFVYAHYAFRTLILINRLDDFY